MFEFKKEKYEETTVAPEEENPAVEEEQEDLPGSPEEVPPPQAPPPAEAGASQSQTTLDPAVVIQSFVVMFETREPNRWAEVSRAMLKLYSKQQTRGDTIKAILGAYARP